MVVVLALVVALGAGAFFYLRNRGGTEPIPGQERCVATANDSAVAVDLDQAHYASIIVGLSGRGDKDVEQADRFLEGRL